MWNFCLLMTPLTLHKFAFIKTLGRDSDSWGQNIWGYLFLIVLAEFVDLILPIYHLQILCMVFES